MLLSTLTTIYKPALYHCRHASVLASSATISPNTTNPSATTPLHPEFIVTPSSAPFTTPSNNCFHPSHIPKKTQLRLTLDELRQVLDSSKQILYQLQQEYVDKSSLPPSELEHYLEKLTKEQIKLMKSLSTQNGKKK
ncbi:hypothetical protein BJ944DRAFT_259936 [Cunninghamella echinulata]|nr:hypothetical protein BJ944DRAFT_259936 [Cunninghamella echinulata]